MKLLNSNNDFAILSFLQIRYSLHFVVSAVLNTIFSFLLIWLHSCIVIPQYVASFGGFKLDSKITYEINDKKHVFLVSGILEEMQYGNYGKGMIGAYLPEQAYENFIGEYEENMITEYSILVNRNIEINDLNNDINKLLEEKNISALINSDKSSTKEARTMICDLLILVLVVFALVILLVSIFLCKFRISNSIEEDMANMGVLKALGYTGNMIIGSVVLPYLIVTLIASLLGVIASYAILPALSSILTLQAGFSFELLFDIKGLVCIEVLLLFIVVVFT